VKELVPHSCDIKFTTATREWKGETNYSTKELVNLLPATLCTDKQVMLFLKDFLFKKDICKRICKLRPLLASDKSNVEKSSEQNKCEESQVMPNNIHETSATINGNPESSVVHEPSHLGDKSGSISKSENSKSKAKKSRLLRELEPSSAGSVAFGSTKVRSRRIRK
jgi:hypothetical protein